jgi:hypothetical protein
MRSNSPIKLSSMKLTTLVLSGACMLWTTRGTSQPPKPDAVTPTVTAHIEVDEHKHSLTVRFFLKNNTDRDAEVEYGRGRSGLEVVPNLTAFPAPRGTLWVSPLWIQLLGLQAKAVLFRHPNP